MILASSIEAAPGRASLPGQGAALAEGWSAAHSVDPAQSLLPSLGAAAHRAAAPGGAESFRAGWQALLASLPESADGSRVALNGAGGRKVQGSAKGVGDAAAKAVSPLPVAGPKGLIASRAAQKAEPAVGRTKAKRQVSTPPAGMASSSQPASSKIAFQQETHSTGTTAREQAPVANAELQRSAPAALPQTTAASAPATNAQPRLAGTSQTDRVAGDSVSSVSGLSLAVSADSDRGAGTHRKMTPRAAEEKAARVHSMQGNPTSASERAGAIDQAPQSSGWRGSDSDLTSLVAVQGESAQPMAVAGTDQPQTTAAPALGREMRSDGSAQAPVASLNSVAVFDSKPSQPEAFTPRTPVDPIAVDNQAPAEAERPEMRLAQMSDSGADKAEVAATGRKASLGSVSVRSSAERLNLLQARSPASQQVSSAIEGVRPGRAAGLESFSGREGASVQLPVARPDRMQAGGTGQRTTQIAAPALRPAQLATPSHHSAQGLTRAGSVSRPRDPDSSQPGAIRSVQDLSQPQDLSEPLPSELREAPDSESSSNANQQVVPRQESHDRLLLRSDLAPATASQAPGLASESVSSSSLAPGQSRTRSFESEGSHVAEPPMAARPLAQGRGLGQSTPSIPEPMKPTALESPAANQRTAQEIATESASPQGVKQSEQRLPALPTTEEVKEPLAAIAGDTAASPLNATSGSVSRVAICVPAASGEAAPSIVAKAVMAGGERRATPRRVALAHSVAGLDGPRQGIPLVETQATGLVSDASGVERETGKARTAASLAGEFGTGSVAAVAASQDSREAFEALDASESLGRPAWIHAGSQRAEAGFEDPSLGWVGVRAEQAGGRVHAEVVARSTDAAQALSGHMAGLSAYLAEHQPRVGTLTVSAPETRWTGPPADRGAGNEQMQQGAGNQSEKQSMQEGGGGAQAKPLGVLSASRSTVAGPSLFHSGPSRGPELETAAGVHISVMA